MKWLKSPLANHIRNPLTRKKHVQHLGRKDSLSDREGGPTPHNKPTHKRVRGNPRICPRVDPDARREVRPEGTTNVRDHPESESVPPHGPHDVANVPGTHGATQVHTLHRVAASQDPREVLGGLPTASQNSQTMGLTTRTRSKRGRAFGGIVHARGNVDTSVGRNHPPP